MSGSDEFHVGTEELMGIVQETIDSGGGLGDVVETIAERIDDDAWNECDPNMDDYGDYEYNEHESSDSGMPIRTTPRTRSAEMCCGIWRNIIRNWPPNSKPK